MTLMQLSQEYEANQTDKHLHVRIVLVGILVDDL